jgi:adenosylcobinamide-phosphate synthase
MRAGVPLGAAAGLLADRLLGEPPNGAHPVAAFGAVMTGLEVAAWRDSRPAGVVFAAAGTGLGLAAGLALGSGFAATAAATAVVVAGRALAGEARRIGAALTAGDLEAARTLLPALAGRDAQVLDEKGVTRAVVESTAENTVDAVVAPACWAALAGPAGAGAYRAVNTLDAMVGHRSARYARFGWASARLDDVANWVPARLTAVLVAAVRPGAAAQVASLLRHPPKHPSPNAGVAEAAFALALGLRLGGDTVYAGRVDPRPTLGTGRPPEPADIEAAVRLSADVTYALAAVLAGVGAAAAAAAASAAAAAGGSSGKRKRSGSA